MDQSKEREKGSEDNVREVVSICRDFQVRARRLDSIFKYDVKSLEGVKEVDYVVLLSLFLLKCN